MGLGGDLAGMSALGSEVGTRLARGGLLCNKDCPGHHHHDAQECPWPGRCAELGYGTQAGLHWRHLAGWAQEGFVPSLMGEVPLKMKMSKVM